jgi:DNA-binding response OmpR family regulator
MKLNIGLVTKNHEISDDFKTTLHNVNVSLYHNIDVVQRGIDSVFFVDYEEIADSDSAQFYLSRLRKKIINVTVILIFQKNTISELDSTWFFNDFILFPFHKGEIQARLKRILPENSGSDEEISIGQMRINMKEYAVYLNDEKIELTYKELELLRLFLFNRGTVFSRKDVLNRIWGMEYIGGTRTVDVHIRRLRSKLGDDFNSIIETVRNVGYKCRD